LRPYTRSLNPTTDYPVLAPWTPGLKDFMGEFARGGVPFRNDHEHRLWEYGSIMQQLTELHVPKTASILDTGSGASYFPPYLKARAGYEGIVVSDSMGYGDITEWLRAQCFFLGITIPLVVAPVEHLGLDDDSFDVTMCISVIEHLPAEQYEAGLRELHRVTKPGGLLFITSDYFRSQAHSLTSPALGMQHTRYDAAKVRAIPKLIDVEWVDNGSPVGVTDLKYHGDYVNNYSFVNMCLRKR
jgi:SAM-dependent methyltransferase